MMMLSKIIPLATGVGTMEIGRGSQHFLLGVYVRPVPRLSTNPGRSLGSVALNTARYRRCKQSPARRSATAVVDDRTGLLAAPATE